MKKTERSPGFSLILSLTVMTGVVLLLVSLSAFITIESRAAMNGHLAVRARLNAVVSMRLALAHLQQEAGADRRATARADITQTGAPTSSLSNPMWTGVWRTDKPDLPPAWLVSGRGDRPAGAQMASLSQTGDKADYPEEYWAPWQTPAAIPPAGLVQLVGRGSATPADETKPSGLVTLPKVSLPDDDGFGSYAYWVGDEGIKARVNLADKRSVSASSAERILALRSPVNAGLTGLPGLDGLTRPEQLELLDSTRQLPLLGGFASETLVAPQKNLFHDISLVSAGVLADSFHGGLRRDLSRAFELSDDEFADTEFGEGRNRAGTVTPDGAAGTHTENGFAGRTAPKGGADDPMMMQIVTGKNSGNQGVGNGNSAAASAEAAPIFSRTVPDALVSPGHVPSPPQVRGPAWWALRDYHRLYQQLGWSAGAGSGRATTLPELRARTFWPNAAVSRPSGNPEDNGLPNNSIRNRAYSYSDIFDGNLPATLNPNAADVLNGDKGRLVTRPLHVAATPYIHRVSLVFSLTKTVETKPSPKNSVFLNVTPVVVVHNPYNVRMRWEPTSTSGANQAAYPATVCLSNIEGWNLVLRQEGGSGYYANSLFRFFGAKGRSPKSDDTFRIYLRRDADNAGILLEPGELRVFSPAPVAANLPSITEWSQISTCTNQFTPGRALEIAEIINSDDGAKNAVNLTTAFLAEIAPGASGLEPGTFLRMRHALDCWPGDSLLLSKDGTRPLDAQPWSFFLNSSEHTELVLTQTVVAPAGRRFANIEAIPDRPGSGKSATNQPTPFAVVDITAKTADTSRDPFPLFTHSNPLAASLRASGAGRTAASAGNGVDGSPASYQLRTRNCLAWGDVIAQPDGQTAYGGYSASGADDGRRVIVTEIPLAQPVSLAQYAHANFGVRDQQPLLAVGNSFASPNLPAREVVHTLDNGRNWTEFDQSYLLNAALWDGFFLSSLAPWMKTQGAAATLPAHPGYQAKESPDTTPPANATNTIAQVIDAVVTLGSPLDNPRLTVDRSGTTGDAVRNALNDYRRSAAVLLNQGAFNVNSTSVDAWTAFLGGAKLHALQGLSAEAPGKKDNARFIRAVTRLDAVIATGNAKDGSNWEGVANLSDSQIGKLAKAIVAENKARFALRARGERELRKTPGERLFRGQAKSATPYLGLAEFINRFLCSESWANRCGALQAAIFRADAEEGAKLSDRLSYGLADMKVDQSSLAGGLPGQFPHPANIEAGAGGGRVHTALAAPGNLLQSDLLQTLGPALATRSDTFTLRCFGEATSPSGETAGAWMEVVVQRTPEFIDRSNPAETGSAAPKPLGVGVPTDEDPTVSRTLTPINHALGRRFKVISTRWLKNDEV